MNIKKILQTIKENDSFLISTHVNPDPDGLCSELALGLFLRALGKKVSIINEERVPKRYCFIPQVKMIKGYHSAVKNTFDVAIVLDCGELERVGKVMGLVQDCRTVVNIDHHITNKDFGDQNLVLPAASSTSEILYDFLMAAKAKLTRDIAVNLYLGIVTDTGSFRYENTTSKTHAIISRLMQYDFCISDLYRQLYESIPLNDIQNYIKIIKNFRIMYKGKVLYVTLKNKDLKSFSEHFDLKDKIFKFLRTIKGVEVVVIFVEKEDKSTRVNFRSQSHLDVAKLSSYFQGGGHKKASGCIIQGNIRTAQKRVFSKIKEMLNL